VIKFHFVKTDIYCRLQDLYSHNKWHFGRHVCAV